MTNYKRVACFLSFICLAFPAYAGGPQLKVEAFCDADTGEYKVQYESTAWIDCETYPKPDSTVRDVCSNERVVISINDEVEVDDEFNAGNNYLLSGASEKSFQPGDVVTVTAEALDSWGDFYRIEKDKQSISATVTIEEDPDCTTTEQGVGRFTGGGHFSVDEEYDGFYGGGRITFGLTIHCDLLLSNNLEINWKDDEGNSYKFHLLEHTAITVCSDDPDIIQAPPAAPLDTLEGVGFGRVNNMGGYSIVFTLVDSGEPGRKDEVAFYIYESAAPGNVILDTDGLQELQGGNLQAHYDQPHKNK